MTRLTRGEVKYEWGDPCERAFHKFKRRLTSAYVLIVPERGHGYIMCCDASNDGLRCVLIQSRRVAAYGSQQCATNYMEKNLRQSRPQEFEVYFFLFPQRDLKFRQRWWLMHSVRSHREHGMV